MKKAIAFCALATCFALSCAQVKKVHRYEARTSAIPALHITNDTSATALKISSLSIDVVIAANIATTTFDIHFYNPNERILEGEFEFPLAEGQHITRYALDMNGTLREGVVVEKATARVAFENTIRRRVDPGLVEKTKGNNFRTRIYPLPAKGSRRIVVAIEQTLEQQTNDLLYQLPLYAQQPIDQFSLKVAVIKSAVQPQLEENKLSNFRFNKWRDAFVAEYKAAGFVADQTVAFSIPGTASNSDIALTENHEGQTYFYVNSKIAPQYKDKTNPGSIGLLWDVSASGDKRDLEKEMELLQQYLSGLGNVTVSLLPFNVYMQSREDFAISGGNTTALMNRLKKLLYDGGTQFGAIDLSQYRFDEVLLFSDGLSTFGRQEMIFGNSPVRAITSAPSADYSYLKFIAQQSHGSFIDLGKQGTTNSLEQLKGQSLQIVNIAYDPAAIEELVAQPTPVLNNGLSFSGKLKTASALVKVELGFGKEVILTKEFTITKSAASDYDQVKRIWATMQVSQLEMEYEKNKDAITKLGTSFSIVTRNTSLLVLDRVEDYVQYGITPPADLQKEYAALLKEKQATAAQEKENAVNEALEAMTLLKEWWKQDFSPPKKTRRNPAGHVNTTITTINQDGLSDMTYSVVDSTRANGSGTYFYLHTDANASAPEPMKEEMEAVSISTVGADGAYKRDEEKNKEVISKAEIELNEWKPDELYLKILQQTPAKDRVLKYLELKKQYNLQPSFFVDVARFFIENNEMKTGVQVLSNICEMKLEEPVLLRIVANQLMEAGEKELAVETFRQLLYMKEEDPQSYRDLALAYNETEHYQQAVDLLYKLIAGNWDGRFGDVKGVALNEMNAIISAHPSEVQTAAIDPRFIYAMPVDVRIVIGWNTDNSDIDLWVTDPRKEKCFFENTQTAIGGRISKDVTQGYGPEEFLLKKALNGDYSIDVNLYGDTRQTLGGPISIKADLFTDFGKPTQQKKTINLRVTSNKEVVKLGALKFGA